MPAPRGSETPELLYHRQVIRTTNPRVAAWMEANPDDPAAGVVWNRTDSSTRMIASTIRSAENVLNIRAEADPDGPADEWDANQIWNGDFTVLTNNMAEGHHQSLLRVHLVLDGALRGKRIIKIKRPGSAIYAGFAFLCRNGSLRVWSRFANDESLQADIEAARLMLASLSGDIPAALRGGTLASVEVVRPRCNHCNATISLPSGSRRGYHLCAACSFQPEVQRRTPPPAPNPRPRRVSRLARTTAVSETTVIPMCQVTGKYVQ